MKHIAEQRNTLYRSIRSFFEKHGYTEVETPILVTTPGMEPNLFPFETFVRDTSGTEVRAALITSPEYSMKKLLGSGLEKIFTITKVFRNNEPNPQEGSKEHLHEFSMLEWYVQELDYMRGMDETEALVRNAAMALGKPLDQESFARIHLPTEFQKLGIDLAKDETAALFSACSRLDIATAPSDTPSDLFHRIFLAKIEPNLPTHAFVYDFPPYQAALARTNDAGFAERFELYMNGHELCNAFTELTDPNEQRKRFQIEREERKQTGKSTFPIDEELLRLLPSIRTPTFGNALGLDRLLMVLTSAPSIQDTVLFPPSFHN